MKVCVSLLIFIDFFNKNGEIVKVICEYFIVFYY